MTFDRYRHYTQARIGLGHKSPAIPTATWLDFAFHHARAVDAIYTPWQLYEQEEEIARLGLKCERINTMVSSREEYLMRPDLGRRLDKKSVKLLSKRACSNNAKIVIAATNGLSSLAMENHLYHLLQALLDRFANFGLEIFNSSILLATNGRVALIDDIGEILKPKLGIIIIGERPGLSSADSLAIYLTYQPELGKSDAHRNCLSNIRPPHGMDYNEAAKRTAFLCKQALDRQLSGVMLKDDSTNHLVDASSKLK